MREIIYPTCNCEATGAIEVGDIVLDGFGSYQEVGKVSDDIIGLLIKKDYLHSWDLEELTLVCKREDRKDL